MMRHYPRKDAPLVQRLTSNRKKSSKGRYSIVLSVTTVLSFSFVFFGALWITPDVYPDKISHRVYLNLKNSTISAGQRVPLRKTRGDVAQRPSNSLKGILKDVNFDLLKATPLSQSNYVHYEIIFSTGCTTYQDWQSFLVFFFAKKSGQPGNVTRIVSGCNQEEEDHLRILFEKTIRPLSPNFFLHFTPDFSKIVKPGKSYKYFNKPYGTRHWLESAQGFPEAPRNPNAIVVLLDPDQIILSPFTNNNFTNTLWKFIEKTEDTRIRIEHGQPMGQLYGFGLQWLDKVRIDYVTGTDNSPIKSMDRKEAQRGYIVGPPYISTAVDMYKISTTWSDFVPRVHDEYPYLLAEMFAYSLAAAHLQLSHQTATSFMISKPGIHKAEGWEYILDIPDDEICEYPPPSPLKRPLPNVMHFCQRYGLGPYFFGKYKQPHDFLSCEHPLYQTPPQDLLHKYSWQEFPGSNGEKLVPNKKEAKEHAYSVCLMIQAMNDAARYYKKQHCGSSVNWNETMIFIKDTSR